MRPAPAPPRALCHAPPKRAPLTASLHTLLSRCRSGPRPPFDGTITIHPKVGDLLLFPSWLTHEVVATPSSDARISIAFNMPGEWADTAGVAAHFPLERS